MKLMPYFSLVPLILLSGMHPALAENATGADNGAVEEEVVVIEHNKYVSVPRTFGSSTIDNWYVLDNKNIVIETTREKYKATFMSTCPGIRFTDSIGLSTMGPYELDRTTTVILPGGMRCHISELVRYTPEMEQRDKEAKAKERDKTNQD